MFGKTSIRNAGRRSLHLATGITAIGALLLLGSTSAAAASGTQVITGSTSGGVLSIAAPAALTLPTLVAGSSTAATNLGSVSWTDTMNDSVVSSVTLAATNLWHAAGAGLYIPWADFTITVDPTPMSGYPESVVASQGVVDQAIRLLSKPFMAVDLLDHVRAVLDG